MDEAALTARGFPLVPDLQTQTNLSLPAFPLIASADASGSIHVWRAGDDAAPLVYAGHSDPVRSIAFSPLPSAREGYFGGKTGYTGYLVASVANGEENTVAHIWLAESGELCRVVRGAQSAGPVVWAPFAALDSGSFIFDGAHWFLNMPEKMVALKEPDTQLHVNGISPQVVSRGEEYLHIRTTGPRSRLVACFTLPSEAHGAPLCMQAVGQNACQFAFGTRQGAIMVYAMNWVDPKFAALKRV
jgi:hypothetical protein